jgi:hypothetical protein
MTQSTENLELQGGEQETPNPASSPNGQATSSPADAKTLELVLKRLDKLERGEQSNKDKGIAKLSSGLAETREQVESIRKLIEKGLDEDEIVEKLAIKRLLKAQEETPVSEVAPPVSPGKPTAAPRVDREAIARNNGIDITSAEFTEISSIDSDDEYISQLVALATGRYKSTSMQPNPAAIMPTSPTGESIPKATSEQYIKEMQAARGKGYETGRQIRDKYRKLGVKVDEISLA